MKKILFMFVAVTVLVVPAWAVVNITATTTQVDIGGTPADTDEVVITYENTEPNRVRAFAFDITVQDPCGDPNADARIGAIDDANLNVDYWVYPGSIDINDAGAVNDVGTPIGDPCQLPSDTKGGLGTAGITVEMGSLYVGEVNAPASSGVLLKLYVDDNCLVKMAGNVGRGGVVMEGVGSKATVNYVGTSVNMYTATDIDQWRYVGRPKCWCRFKGGRQCHGDADGRGQGKASNIWVSTWDAQVFNVAKNLTYPNVIGQTILTEGGDLVPWVCADYDHLGAGKAGDIAVSIPDAAIFNTYKNLTDVDPNCP